MCVLFATGDVEEALRHLIHTVDLETVDLTVQGKSVPTLRQPKPVCLPLVVVQKNQKVQVGDHKAHIRNVFPAVGLRIHWWIAQSLE